MSLNDLSLREFSGALAGRSSVPGGGGASAAVAALGTALGSMVGNFTLGKKKHADAEPEIRRLLAEAETLREALLTCVDADAAAFEPLSRAYGIPRDDPSRGEIMEKCLREAAAVPMRILELSCRGIELHRQFAEKGSTMMLSDVGTGVVFCWAALYGAALNVKVNTSLMADRSYAEDLNKQVDEALDAYWRLADEVYENVYRRYC